MFNEKSHYEHLDSNFYEDDFIFALRSFQHKKKTFLRFFFFSVCERWVCAKISSGHLNYILCVKVWSIVSRLNYQQINNSTNPMKFIRRDKFTLNFYLFFSSRSTHFVFVHFKLRTHTPLRGLFLFRVPISMNTSYTFQYGVRFNLIIAWRKLET